MSSGLHSTKKTEFIILNKVIFTHTKIKYIHTTLISNTKKYHCGLVKLITLCIFVSKEIIFILECRRR